MSHLTNMLITGIVATLVMDLWGLLRKPLLGLPAADYRLVGRWVSHLARGKFRHEAIVRSPEVRGEALTGWLAHYLLGMVFAAVFLALTGDPGIDRPSLGSALAFGLATVMVPFLIMQPAMGINAAPAARIQSLITHLVFGLGLFAGTRLASYLAA
jgi:hypothetical protein